MPYDVVVVDSLVVDVIVVEVDVTDAVETYAIEMKLEAKSPYGCPVMVIR